MVTIGPYCICFSKLINYFLVINSLFLKIKYKLYVSILFTIIPFVFAFIFKFIVRGPNPDNSLNCRYRGADVPATCLFTNIEQLMSRMVTHRCAQIQSATCRCTVDRCVRLLVVGLHKHNQIHTDN